MTPAIRVLPDAVAAAGAAAERIVRLSEAAPPRERPFTLAVSGGSTPEPMFRRLAEQPDGAGRWPSWQLFLVDERCVPEDDPRSNLGLARRLWLRPARFPSANVHSVRTSLPADEAADRYDEELHRFFQPREPGTFDVVALGIGPDGHTASLFPGSPTLAVADRYAVAEPRPSRPPLVPRVTLTLEALRRARHAVFLVCGTEKRAALARILLPASSRGSTLPAGRVAAAESVEWFLDRAAAPPRLDPTP